mmetsp:Transcript_27794/g.89562  ORF Transcript_27794/g.89562 Transcript_27794/m.89562 type:complete len:452 (-) Transcript_27794:4109-5464(-)
MDAVDRWPIERVAIGARVLAAGAVRGVGAGCGGGGHDGWGGGVAERLQPGPGGDARACTVWPPRLAAVRGSGLPGGCGSCVSGMCDGAWRGHQPFVDGGCGRAVVCSAGSGHWIRAANRGGPGGPRGATCGDNGWTVGAGAGAPVWCQHVGSRRCHVRADGNRVRGAGLQHLRAAHGAVVHLGTWGWVRVVVEGDGGRAGERESDQRVRPARDHCGGGRHRVRGIVTGRRGGAAAWQQLWTLDLVLAVGHLRTRWHGFHAAVMLRGERHGNPVPDQPWHRPGLAVGGGGAGAKQRDVHFHAVLRAPHHRVRDAQRDSHGWQHACGGSWAQLWSGFLPAVPRRAAGANARGGGSGRRSWVASGGCVDDTRGEQRDAGDRVRHACGAGGFHSAAGACRSLVQFGTSQRRGSGELCGARHHERTGGGGGRAGAGDGARIWVRQVGHARGQRCGS